MLLSSSKDRATPWEEEIAKSGGWKEVDERFEAQGDKELETGVASSGMAPIEKGILVAKEETWAGKNEDGNFTS